MCMQASKSFAMLCVRACKGLLESLLITYMYCAYAIDRIPGILMIQVETLDVLHVGH